MKVTIIGPGAMGCLFAARMARAGLDVTLVDHRADRCKSLAAQGIRVEGVSGTYLEKVRIVSTVPTKSPFTIVLVKSSDTNKLNLQGHALVLTLQNGLGNAETLCSKAGNTAVLAGITYQAATLLAPGHVSHVAEGKTLLGSWTSASVDPAIEALTTSGFEVEVTESPSQCLWEKTAINAGINPITALLDIPNGAILEQTGTRELLRDLVVEATKVASTEGYRFPYSLVERAEAVCEATAGNISSMLQDIRAKRKTEIDAISGEILRRAQLASLPTPRTRVVYQLVKGLDNR